MKQLAGLGAWFWLLGVTAFAEWRPLWEGAIPGAEQVPALEETVNARGSYTNTVLPAYQVFLPDPARRSGAAVVIFPGGGYGMLAMNHEGHAYAAWLNQRGIAAVLVKYRVSSKDHGFFRFPGPLLDARRAIQLTREHAAEWGLDPAKIGVMGSSAGGHLASMCATMAQDPLEGYAQPTSAGPDAWRANFAILVYPVITMSDPWGHTGSKRRLLGDQPGATMEARVSTHLRVDAMTPPCFLIHAADDMAVPLRNSTEFAARCAENRVPVVCHVQEKGGHGFGLGKSGESGAWPLLLEQWLVARGLAKQ